MRRPVVQIGSHLLRMIEDHARREAPAECCGLLIGGPEAITDAVAARNTAHDSRRRYTIDPSDHFNAIRQARVVGLDVIGAYHSHPAGAPIPSATDRAEAFEDFLFLIVGLARTDSEFAAWQYCAEPAGGNFRPVVLVPIP